MEVLRAINLRDLSERLIDAAKAGKNLPVERIVGSSWLEQMYPEWVSSVLVELFCV